ncbi:MAG: DUF4424 family protein [Vulcanimicrobiota bacterium]
MRFRLICAAAVVLFAVLMFSISTACADGGVITAPGGLINTKDASEVALEKEVIDFHFFSDSTFRSHCRVTCDYTFRNTSTQPVTVKAGFPIAPGWPNRIATLKEFEKFRVTVDGKAIEVNKEEVSENVPADSSKFHYSHYYTWNMTFKAGEKRKMTNSYVQRLSSGEGAAFFGYVLSTGASWKGAIKELDVTARFPPHSIISSKPFENDRFRGFTNSYLDVHHIISIAGPPGPVIEGNRLTWKLKDYEPTDDQNISIFISTSLVQMYNNDNRIDFITTDPWQYTPMLRWFGVEFPEMPGSGRVVALAYKSGRKNMEKSYTFRPVEKKGWQYFRFHPESQEYNFRRGGTEGCTDLFLGTDVISASSILCEKSYEKSGRKLYNEFNVFSPYLLADGRKETAWVEGVSGDGTGESIRVSFPCSCEIEGFTIMNGYCKSRETFKKNNRVKKLEVTYDYGKEVVTVEDEMEIQKIPLRRGATRFVELRILEIYRGSQHRDTAISELDVF